MSRRIHRADLAVSSNGTILLNVAPFATGLGVEALVELALAQPGEVFIGVSLLPHEVRALARGVELTLPNQTGPLVGRRLRPRK